MTGARPLPLRGTKCGLPAASSVTVRDSLTAKFTVGMNLTLIVQLMAAGRLAGQLLVCVKSVPVVMLMMPNGPAPVLVSVTGCDALGVPTT